MHRTHTYTAKLSTATHTRLSHFLAQQRVLYNAALEERIGAYRKAGVSLGLYNQNASLTALRDDAEFSPYDLKCQRSALFTLDRAFKAFFRRVKAGHKLGFPRFKSKDRGVRSFSTSQPRLKSHGRWHSLSFKGIGRLQFKGAINGAVRKARVVKTPLRVVVQVIVALPAVESAPRPPLGSDVGIAARATLSEGTRHVGHQVARERLTVLQQPLAQAKKRSRSRQQRKRMLAKEWQRVRLRERGLLHEMTAALVKQTNGYYVEDLRVQNMMGNQPLARASVEPQGATLVHMLTYKAARAGGWVKKVDPTHTSQDCSRCGTRVEKTLSDRLHVCPACELSIDRDWNAAINVLNRGLGVRPPTGGKTPCGTTGPENGSGCYDSL